MTQHVILHRTMGEYKDQSRESTDEQSAPLWSRLTGRDWAAGSSAALQAARRGSPAPFLPPAAAATPIAGRPLGSSQFRVAHLMLLFFLDYPVQLTDPQGALLAYNCISASQAGRSRSGSAQTSYSTHMYQDSNGKLLGSSTTPNNSDGFRRANFTGQDLSVRLQRSAKHKRNNGELAPALGGRVDVQKSSSLCPPPPPLWPHLIRPAVPFGW